jgi:hypothetical protein
MGSTLWQPSVNAGILKSMKTRLGRSTSLVEIDSHSLLKLNGRIIPFVNSVKYLGVLFDKGMTWRLYIQMIEAKAFRTFIQICSLFKSERLSANIKLTLHNVLIRSVMTYACPAWEFAAECHLLKLQRLQNKVLRTIGNFQKSTSVSYMHKAFHNHTFMIT